MINTVIPLAGPNRFASDDFHYPKPLIEVNNVPLIEHVIRCMDRIDLEQRYIFIVNQDDCQQYHLDSLLRLLCGDDTVIIPLKAHTAGAACSVLMAVDYINNDDPLVITNSDHIIDSALDSHMRGFIDDGDDAAVLCFESVHPKWSYVRLDDQQQVIEAAEKRPISKNAIAGFYYYKRGQDFVRSAMDMIAKDAHVDGRFYIAPSLNELILSGKKIGCRQIDKSAYFHFYDSKKLQEYEKYLASQKSGRTG